MDKLILKFLIIIFCIIFQSNFVFASPKKIKILKEYHGNFITNVKGIGESKPPYVRVVRSKKGINYLFNKFRKIRNLITHNKALYLERKLLKTNFSSKMVIAILSFPTDNYKITNIKIIEHENEKNIEVKVSYFHKNASYSIPPFKAIFYKFYVIKQSHLPVVLTAELINKKNPKKKKKSLTTMYGTLQKWGEQGEQLALINKSKRKKRVFYLKGTLLDELEQYVGKFIALRGEVTLDSESIYEADFLVTKIVKIY